jgi:hypothetical protein
MLGDVQPKASPRRAFSALMDIRMLGEAGDEKENVKRTG